MSANSVTSVTSVTCKEDIHNGFKITTFNTHPGSIVRIVKGWYPQESADLLLRAIQQQLPTGQYQGSAYGKTYIAPRRKFFFGDLGVATFDTQANPIHGIGYAYANNNSYPVFEWDTPYTTFQRMISDLSGEWDHLRIYSPLPSNEEPEGPEGDPPGTIIKHLVQLINQQIGLKIDSVLINEYIGDNYIAPHSDKEALGRYPNDPTKDNSVYGLSLGGRRIMRFKGKSKETTGEKFEFFVDHRDLVIMSGSTQEHYTHAIPKLKKYQDYRVSLTFRQVKG